MHVGARVSARPMGMEVEKMVLREVMRVVKDMVAIRCVVWEEGNG